MLKLSNPFRNSCLFQEGIVALAFLIEGWKSLGYVYSEIADACEGDRLISSAVKRDTELISNLLFGRLILWNLARR